MANPLLHGPRSLVRRATRTVPGLSPESPIAGKRVLITGASSGIGAEAAKAAAARGAQVILVARRAEELEEVAAGIRADGGTAYAQTCDLSDGEAIDALVAAVVAEHGGVDALVNNAGRSIRRSLKISYDRMHDFERTMALNYFAPVRLTLGFLPGMVEQQDGAIVNITSEGLLLQTPKYSAYLASKAALDMWGRIAGKEYFNDGVTVTSVRMPLVRTEMVASTEAYRRLPLMAPRKAGELVVRALEERPVVLNTPVGTALAAFTSGMPRVSDAFIAQVARQLPNSSAAKSHLEKNPSKDS